MTRLLLRRLPAALGVIVAGSIVVFALLRLIPGDPAASLAGPVRAPAGAPNVIVVLLDDMGYADIGPFGSEIPTPALQRLADEGFAFTNYHTTPVCSPARAAPGSPRSRTPITASPVSGWSSARTSPRSPRCSTVPATRPRRCGSGI
ncbi:sulfatase-like hydrolase/transferase [Corynebacterium variabile]|uniref:sulfatase-like hydrolase/transferase n=1 Tax=Corynebacterium variabile TaxID=1727 RepID=UPI00289A3B3C|nr:sulfatase-like hydrolase/transferase [Corynebacterium variabile]